MAITLAQAAVFSETIVGTTQVAATFGSNTVTGHTIVVLAYGYNGPTLVTVSSIAISAGAATFSKIIAAAGSANTYTSGEGWGAANITGGTTPKVTVTFSGTVTLVGIGIYDLAGMPTSLTTDGTAAAGTGNSTAMVTPAITTTNAGSIIFASFQIAGASTTGETGWNPHVYANDGNCSQYQIQTATQSGLTSTGTMSGSPNNYGAFIFALQPSSGSTVSLGSVTMIGAFGIRNSPVVVGKMPSVTMQGLFGIRNAPTMVGKIAGLTMQALFGIRNAPVLVGKLPGVSMVAALGITTASIGKLLIASTPLQGRFGIRNSPVLVAGQPIPPQMIPYTFWGGGHY